jgi:2-polyprenyl-6-methoxyphenol hydroxylase-like FAD-dependent oxidoreductase
MSEALPSKRAVVIGGSMAGLLAARVLSDHFAEVTIVERDRFPDGADFRAAVPHGRHAHALLERGRRIVEALLPGIQDEMIAAGARLLDATRDFSWLSWFGESVRYESGLPALAVSRLMLEHHVRRRVLALPNVRVRTGAMVARLEGTADRVLGARLQDGEVVASDLVVDAGGRDAATPRWLEALGVEPPTDTVVKPFLGYASRWYEPPTEPVWDRNLVMVASRPPRFTRGMALWRVERGRFIVTMMGMNADYPATNEADYLDWARSLEVPGLMDWFAAARPLGPIYGFRFEQNRLRHFERCRMPHGLIAVGDAVASFNPVYGQGMTTAAMGVELLGDVLAERGTNDIGRVYHRRLAKVLAPAWAQTTTEDLRYPGTEGRRAFAHRIVRAYVDRVFLIASTRPNVRTALFRVLNMVDPAMHLFKPSLLLRVLFTRIPKGTMRAQQALAIAA